jgi:hypothetical protein
MVVNYALERMRKQTVPAYRTLHTSTVPQFMWGIEEDLKYHNNQPAGEKMIQEYPDDESDELTTTLWRSVGGF